MAVSEQVRSLRAAHFEALGFPHVPCDVCELPTDKTATKRCDACWEVEHRLAAYLRVGGEGAREFVRRALDEANFDAMFDADERRR